MDFTPNHAAWEVMKVFFKPHPWHGLSLGSDAPDLVTCFIEIVPADTVKYEVDKTTGYLRVDRPQRYSNASPCLYGFLPQTLCGPRLALHAANRTGRAGLGGDGDPLDVCVFSERPISHGDLILDAIPIGGLRMIDHQEADDKIVAVLKGDALYGRMKDISELPDTVVQKLIHYFLTYKQMPGNEEARCEITHVYDRAEAQQIILESRRDYDERFGELACLLDEMLTAHGGQRP